MKRSLILATVLAAMSASLLSQEPAAASSNAIQSKLTPVAIDVNDPTGNVAMIGDAEIQSEIGISLADHLISGVQCKVTDNEIDIYGNVSDKHDKNLVHEIAEAYADGRKVRDHVKEASVARK